MEEEYSIIETTTLALPGDDWDLATVSSPGIESMDQAADAASTALRHAEAEGSRGLACFGEPVLVSELDAQEQMRQLVRHMDNLKVQIANQEDANMGVDLLGLNDPADAGSLDSYIHPTCPDLSPLIWAVDIRRDKGPLGQDMLQQPLGQLTGRTCRVSNLSFCFPKVSGGL